jgi:hypothetical protein
MLVRSSSGAIHAAQVAACCSPARVARMARALLRSRRRELAAARRGAPVAARGPRVRLVRLAQRRCGHAVPSMARERRAPCNRAHVPPRPRSWMAHVGGGGGGCGGAARPHRPFAVSLGASSVGARMARVAYSAQAAAARCAHALVACGGARHSARRRAWPRTRGRLGRVAKSECAGCEAASSGESRRECSRAYTWYRRHDLTWPDMTWHDLT